jgi:hypothetical protein
MNYRKSLGAARLATEGDKIGKNHPTRQRATASPLKVLDSELQPAHYTRGLWGFGGVPFDAIVQPPNIAVWHHSIDETDIYVLPPAVGIAQACVNPLWWDLRLADATSMLSDLIRERLRTSREQRCERDEP